MSKSPVSVVSSSVEGSHVTPERKYVRPQGVHSADYDSLGYSGEQVAGIQNWSLFHPQPINLYDLPPPKLGTGELIKGTSEEYCTLHDTAPEHAPYVDYFVHKHASEGGTIAFSLDRPAMFLVRNGQWEELPLEKDDVTCVTKSAETPVPAQDPDGAGASAAVVTPPPQRSRPSSPFQTPSEQPGFVPIGSPLQSPVQSPPDSDVDKRQTDKTKPPLPLSSDTDLKRALDLERKDETAKASTPHTGVVAPRPNLPVKVTPIPKRDPPAQPPAQPPARPPAQPPARPPAQPPARPPQNPRDPPQSPKSDTPEPELRDRLLVEWQGAMERLLGKAVVGKIQEGKNRHVFENTLETVHQIRQRVDPENYAPGTDMGLTFVLPRIMDQATKLNNYIQGQLVHWRTELTTRLRGVPFNAASNTKQLLVHKWQTTVEPFHLQVSRLVAFNDAVWSEFLPCTEKLFAWLDLMGDKAAFQSVDCSRECEKLLRELEDLPQSLEDFLPEVRDLEREHQQRTVYGGAMELTGENQQLSHFGQNPGRGYPSRFVETDRKPPRPPPSQQKGNTGRKQWGNQDSAMVSVVPDPAKVFGRWGPTPEVEMRFPPGPYKRLPPRPLSLGGMCQLCGGQHMTDQCPELEMAQGPLAPSHPPRRVHQTGAGSLPGIALSVIPPRKPQGGRKAGRAPQSRTNVRPPESPVR